MPTNCRTPQTTFENALKIEREKADFVFSQYDIFNLDDTPEFNPYGFIPATSAHRWKLFCTFAARGNVQLYKRLFEELPYSEVVEMYALEMTRTFRPTD